MKTLSVETWGIGEHAIIERTYYKDRLLSATTLAVCGSMVIANRIIDSLTR